jgi:prephenate dehydrogenase
MLFERCAVVGTGLLGASFGLAVKRAGMVGEVVGVSSPAVVERAIAVGAVDRPMTLDAAVRWADLVLLARPIHGIIAAMRECGAAVRADALVTDVGSTKELICKVAEEVFPPGVFVGGHPMAGKESRGPDAASGELFEGRTWVLTREEGRLRRLIEAVGARVLVMDAAAHDRNVALSSHLPQLVSTALMSYLSERGTEWESVAGPGIRDMSRLALSSYELWGDILETNAANVEGALDGLIAELQAMRGRYRDAFERGAGAATRVRGRGES